MQDNADEDTSGDPRDCRVRLHLEIRLEDGTEALSTFDGDPLDIAPGDGTLVPALERLLPGLEAGVEEQIAVAGSEIYGQPVEDKVHWLARSDFPGDMVLEPGQMVAFDTPGGQETAGIVRTLEGDRVQVDFNHPLASHALRIRVLVLATGAPEESRESH